MYSSRDDKKIRKTFPTRAAAMSWRDDARGQVRRRELRAAAPLTFQEAADEWMAGIREGLITNRSKEIFKPSTIRQYESALRLRLLPALGRKKLGAITTDDLQDLIKEWRVSGLDASTIGVSILPVRGIYRSKIAKRAGVTINPTIGLDMPKVKGRRDRIASPEEAARLLAAVPAKDRPIWAIAMYAGLRLGEIRGLHVEDVNLAAGVIHVRRGWDALEGEIETKNRKDRKVPIPALLRDHLDEHLLSLEWRDRADGLVFGETAVDPFNRKTVHGDAMRAWGWKETRATVQGRDRRLGWEKIRPDALEPIGFHEARHTYASLMIEAGVNVKTLSEYMGHSSIVITLDRYGHLFPGNEREAAAKLDALLGRASDPGSCASFAPVASGSNLIQSDSIGVEIP